MPGGQPQEVTWPQRGGFHISFTSKGSMPGWWRAPQPQMSRQQEAGSHGKAMEGAAPESLRDSPRSQRAAESRSRSALV